MNINLNEVAKDLNSLKAPNWHPIWEPFMRKYKCNYICELGVYKGENFLNMIRHGPKVAVAVDAWKDSGVHPRKYDDYNQKEFDQQYEYFKSRVADMPFVQIIREDTVKASNLFHDEYFDFVYVDADHSAEACYADITAWYPKVKQGKFLVGHDYPRYGVGEAVDKFVKKERLELVTLFPSTWSVVKR